MLILNKSLKPVKTERISIGKTDASLVDIKIVAKSAVNHLASAIIIAHNHPSGNLKPSSADIDLTQKIKSALSLFDIQLLDHLIVSESQYYSFADEGKI